MKFIRKLSDANEHDGTCCLCDKMKGKYAEYYCSTSPVLGEGNETFGAICEECFKSEESK